MLLLIDACEVQVGSSASPPLVSCALVTQPGTHCRPLASGPTEGLAGFPASAHGRESPERAPPRGTSGWVQLQAGGVGWVDRGPPCLKRPVRWEGGRLGNWSLSSEWGCAGRVQLARRKSVLDWSAAFALWDLRGHHSRVSRRDALPKGQVCERQRTTVSQLVSFWT